MFQIRLRKYQFCTMEGNYKHIDLSYLELMSDGDNQMKSVLLDMLLAEPVGEFEKMKTLADAKNWDELKQVSHKMKSTLPYIGYEELSETNKRIDKMLWERGNSAISDDIIDQTIPELVKNACNLYQKAVLELTDARNNLMNPV